MYHTTATWAARLVSFSTFLAIFAPQPAAMTEAAAVNGRRECRSHQALRAAAAARSCEKGPSGHHAERAATSGVLCPACDAWHEAWGT
jgi:hypothetical protein